MKMLSGLARRHYIAGILILLITVALLPGLVSCSIDGIDGPTIPKYSLTMMENPAEGGTATDMTNFPPYLEGAVVGIKAVADPGYAFVNWSAPAGAFADASARQTTFTMPAQDVTVTANFATAYDLTMAVGPAGNGTATDLTGTSPYAAGTVVSIEAMADPGYWFGNWTAPAGTFANANARQTTFTMPAQDVTVTASFAPAPRQVAVLGDYNSQLTNLLLDNRIGAEQRGWDVVADIDEYSVLVVNRPAAPGEVYFLEVLEAASDNGVGVVFTSSYSTDGSWGISLLQWHLGDPAGQTFAWGWGDVYHRVTQPHPIFDGWSVGDEITIITGGDRDHAWFWDYSGTTIGEVGSTNQGIRGDAVAVGTYGGSTHVLLASLGPQWYTDVTHWTDDGRTIFINAVLFAGGI